MSCQSTTSANGSAGVELDGLPDGWEPVEPDDLSYREYRAWEHSVTELRVSVSQDKRPTQMSDPRTSRDDVGYVARVRGTFGANLTYPLASRTASFEAAERFMHAYPNGRFEVPHPSKRPASEPVEWRGR